MKLCKNEDNKHYFYIHLLNLNPRNGFVRMTVYRKLLGGTAESISDSAFYYRCYRAWLVRPSVCMSLYTDSTVCHLSHSCTLLNTDGRNEMPFGRHTSVVPSNTVLDRGAGPPRQVEIWGRNPQSKLGIWTEQTVACSHRPPRRLSWLQIRWVRYHRQPHTTSPIQHVHSNDT